MTAGIPTRPLLGFVLLQVGLFQWALWSYLGGNARAVMTAAGLSVGALALGVLVLMVVRWQQNRPPAAERLQALQTQRPPTPEAAQRALLLGTLGFAVSFMTWGLLSPIALEFKTLYDLSNTQVSLLIAIPVLLGSVGRLPMGMLADRFGPRRVHMLLLLVMILPLVLMGFTRSFSSLLLVAFFLGLGGTSFAVGVPYVSRFFPPEKQGLALGIYGAGNIGQALGALLSPRIAASFGWSYSFWLMTIPVVIMWALFLLFGEEAPRPAAKAKADGVSVWFSPQMWLLSVFYFVTFGGFVAFGNYLPKLMVELFSLDKALAGTYTAAFVFGATAFRPIGGWLSDKIGAPQILLVVFATVILAAFGLASGPALTAFLGLMGLLAISLGTGNGAVFKLVPQFFPGKTGVVTGVVGAMGGLGGFFPPLVLGLLRDHVGSYTMGFIFLAAFAVAALLGVLSLTWRPGAGQLVPARSKA